MLGHSLPLLLELLFPALLACFFVYIFHKVFEPYPLYPLPLIKGKGKYFIEEAPPLFTLLSIILLQGEGNRLLENPS